MCAPTHRHPHPPNTLPRPTHTKWYGQTCFPYKRTESGNLVSRLLNLRIRSSAQHHVPVVLLPGKHSRLPSGYEVEVEPRPGQESVAKTCRLWLRRKKERKKLVSLRNKLNCNIHRVTEALSFLLRDAVSSSDYTASYYRLVSEFNVLEWTRREAVLA